MGVKKRILGRLQTCFPIRDADGISSYECIPDLLYRAKYKSIFLDGDTKCGQAWVLIGCDGINRACTSGEFFDGHRRIDTS